MGIAEVRKIMERQPDIRIKAKLKYKCSAYICQPAFLQNSFWRFVLIVPKSACQSQLECQLIQLCFEFLFCSSLWLKK